MSYEIDIRAVGDETKSGDAITFRYGDFEDRDKYTVVVIDGGFKEDGERLAEHIKTWYGTDYVDLVVSTHPDNDHLSGLRSILEDLNVGNLWLHRPWRTPGDIHELFGGRLTRRDVNARILESLETGIELEELAVSRGTTILEPFQGASTPDNSLLVLGPTEEYYNSLAALFIAEEEGIPQLGLMEGIAAGLKKAAGWVQEAWSRDALIEPSDNAVSPLNNASVILLACIEDRCILFTGDAGVPAITLAADYAESHQFSCARNLTDVQIPHHGSKHNVGPTVLDRLIGPIVNQYVPNAPSTKRVFVSAAKKGAPKHPSQRVVNACIRRGAVFYVTKGQSQHYFSKDLKLRPGWIPLRAEEFAKQYKEDD